MAAQSLLADDDDDEVLRLILNIYGVPQMAGREKRRRASVGGGGIVLRVLSLGGTWALLASVFVAGAQGPEPGVPSRSYTALDKPVGAVSAPASRATAPLEPAGRTGRTIYATPVAGHAPDIAQARPNPTDAQPMRRDVAVGPDRVRAVPTGSYDRPGAGPIGKPRENWSVSDDEPRVEGEVLVPTPSPAVPSRPSDIDTHPAVRDTRTSKVGDAHVNTAAEHDRIAHQDALDALRALRLK